MSKDEISGIWIFISIFNIKESDISISVDLTLTNFLSSFETVLLILFGFPFSAIATIAILEVQSDL